MSAGRRWLRRELQVRLMLPVLGFVIVSAVLGGLGAQRLVDRVFDRWLIDAAQSLSRQVRFEDGEAKVDLSAQSAALLTFDAVDRTHYQVLQAGRSVIGDATLAERGDHERRYESGARTFDGSQDGEAVRIALVPLEGAHGASATILVSETLRKRRAAQRDLLLMFAPMVILVVGAALVLGFQVRRTILPLEDIAKRWNEQSHASLEEIPAHDVPRELLPFAAALNDLLARVRRILERERGFAANAAHQLRTPLAGLQLGLARAARAPDLPSARAVLMELESTTQRTSRLVQQLLALSRLDPEVRGEGDWGEVDLARIARGVGESYLEAARARGIELRLHLDGPAGSSVRVRGQSDLLAEALGNLLDNAMHHTPSGGVVTIAVTANPPVLSVTDSGPGIPAHEQERVFERFYRGRSSAEQGSGLGLAIVQEIAALHGARAQVRSVVPNGACVELRFAQWAPSVSAS